ncbi:MAG: glycoside hydrolase family 108 protein [bacterium]
MLNAEGPYTDDPDDSGGPTNRGISWDTWTTFALSMLGVEPTLDNLKKLTKEQALIIYKNQYWDRIKADQIEDGDLRYLLFDFNVTSGSISVKVLQRTINSLGGSIAIDGVIGNKTLALINSINSIELYNKFKLNRQLFYNELVIRRPKDAKYINGWTNRVNTFKNKTISKPKNVNCK